MKARTPRPSPATPAAQATMRRSVASAASSGTATIHGISQELKPPVSQAVYVTRAAKLAEEAKSACANLPVRDRKMAMPIGDNSQRKAAAPSNEGLPLMTRYTGKTQSASSPPSKCEAMNDWWRAAVSTSPRADTCTSELK